MKKSGQKGAALMVLLFIVFLVLKLTKVLTWSWWWITSPLWIPVALGLITLVFVMGAVIKAVRNNNKIAH
ncbi:hypothetical protein ED388_04605 [Muribaculaceae bacterium Isolate-007 (NCI)]|nr:hypothetical protein EEL42_03330 [Muribaculaceae bacterium Isolate-100 (HZI)]RXE66267.1 hypothetical protein ED388_04605 [Muribaculaceae bacterium Isolate-007 (NCI)]